MKTISNTLFLSVSLLMATTQIEGMSTIKEISSKIGYHIKYNVALGAYRVAARLGLSAFKFSLYSTNKMCFLMSVLAPTP